MRIFIDRTFLAYANHGKTNSPSLKLAVFRYPRSKLRTTANLRVRNPEHGFTLIELIVTATILSILMLMALPLARVTIQREREKRLRHALWEMRDAIDRYKDAADRRSFQIKVDSFGYPPDLDTLYKGLETHAGRKLRFLRSIPVDPMTNSKEWGIRSMQDDPESDSWGDKTSSMSIRNPRALPWTGRSTKTGEPHLLFSMVKPSMRSYKKLIRSC